MSYRVIYGDALATAGADWRNEPSVCSERFSTEHEAFYRARELLDADSDCALAVCDPAGNRLAGVRLRLKLGYSGD
jgi:hypothetical protein